MPHDHSQKLLIAIEDLDAVDRARRDGILVVNFTYNSDNALAGGGQNTESNGVTGRGFPGEKLMRVFEAVGE
jgi:microsomal dipeptidase-like Zn-dependent dipeptidase